MNAIAAGMVDTAQPRDGLTEEQIDQIVSSFPLGRLVTPAEIADAVVWLCSDASSFVTGHSLIAEYGAERARGFATWAATAVRAKR